MAKSDVFLTGVERHFADDDVIVSKTDMAGRITYGNRTFLRIADLAEDKAIGAPHNIIRHPDMPHCVFKLLWDTIASGKEIFAYVVNRAVNGDHYWVFAHVTPSMSADGTLVGYHSNRRTANATVVRDVITPLYKALREEEAKHSRMKDGMAAGEAMLMGILKDKGISYDRLIFSL